MRWRKLGRVYVADGRQKWAMSHAYLPTPELLDEKRIRVYVSFLDVNKIGRVGFVDVNATDPVQVLNVSVEPVLEIGNPGTFDDHGVSPSCIVVETNHRYMYYVGWQLGVGVRYYLFSGLAKQEVIGYGFERCSRVPILDRSEEELFIRSAPFVLRQDSSWKMWYVAGSQWVHVQDRIVPTYNLRYLESPDGRVWGAHGRVCLELREGEFGFGRPYVIQTEAGFQLFYSIRSVKRGYRIGYAESIDGLHWLRRDQDVGIDISDTGWDSEMICFAGIIDACGRRYMFYNGNNYGETGFGVAILAEG